MRIFGLTPDKKPDPEYSDDQDGANSSNGGRPGRCRSGTLSTEIEGDVEDMLDSPANEYSRLLPNRIRDSAGSTESRGSSRFLRPDDPAISPYNLLHIRLAHYTTIFLTILAFLWWTLQLLCTFVTPPGLHTRGDIFFSFAYASISLALLLATLMFFSTSSQSVRVLCIVMSVMLLVDLILELAVWKVRHEERWIGIVSVGWTLFTSLWALLVDRIVQSGIKTEEIRLTGRAEIHRSLAEWFTVALSTLTILLINLTVIFITLNIILRSIDASLEMPGRRYWVDGRKYQIHIYCHGYRRGRNGTELPTVLFEGGGGSAVEDGLWGFADEAMERGVISRYCWADRPGFGWSDNAPSPLSAGMASDALSEALAQAGEEGPWVVVGAGVGSAYARIFSSRHMRDVRGLMLIDPIHEDLFHRLSSSRRGFMLWVRGVLSPLGIVRVTGAIFKGRSREDRVWGRAASSSGRYIMARLQEQILAGSLTKREVISSKTIQNLHTPLVIVSSGEKIRTDGEWEGKQRDLCHLTRNLVEWNVAEDAPHEVWRTEEGREMIERGLRKLVVERRDPRWGRDPPLL